MTVKIHIVLRFFIFFLIFVTLFLNIAQAQKAPQQVIAKIHLEDVINLKRNYDQEWQLAVANIGKASSYITHDELHLPTVLTPHDHKLYKQIFLLQNDGHWKEANALIKKLRNDILLGHIYYQRYMHPTKWRSQFKELSQWLKKYNDFPNAGRIYRLALRRKPKNYKAPVAPNHAILEQALIKKSKSKKTNKTNKITLRQILKHTISTSKLRKIKRLQNRMHVAIRRGYITTNLNKLNDYKRNKTFDTTAYAETLGEITKGYFLYKKDNKAVKTAKAAMSISKGHADEALWWGGLAAWRQKNYQDAFVFFDALSKTPIAHHERRSAGGFWAARAAFILGDVTKAITLQTAAAQEGIGFYAIMAKILLGNKINFLWEYPHANVNIMQKLVALPAIRRALALQQIGEISLAEQEIVNLIPRLNKDAKNALMVIAKHKGLARSLLKIARYGIDKNYVRTARYPIPQWNDITKYRVAKGLIFAMAKRESAFDANAISNAGARGLLQILPSTASFIAKKSYRGAKKNFLYDEEINLTLAQDYMLHLLDFFDGNLLLSIASYNAGPGNISKWLKQTNHGNDALLFIESIPSRENRNYIEAIFRDYWVYQIRLNGNLSSLYELAAGHWPTYHDYQKDNIKADNNAN